MPSSFFVSVKFGGKLYDAGEVEMVAVHTQEPAQCAGKSAVCGGD